MATDFAKLIEALADNSVDYVVVGGAALVAHGHVRFTKDLDVAYSRERLNLDRLVSALAPLHPYLRGAPPGLPFVFDAKTLRSGLNFTLRTDAGDIDLLGELTGVGGFVDLAPGALEMTLFGRTVRVIRLDDLERAKRAAGRPQDLFDLEAIRLIRQKKGGT